MKLRLSFLVVITWLLFTLSCQDKYLMGVTPVATGNLQSDVIANCLPKTVAGTFIADKALGDTNYLLVTVLVKTTGTYLIKTNTVNGYSFSASGTFTTTGLNRVKLMATGKPIATGSDDFAIQLNASTCHITISVLPVGGIVTPPAVYSLTGAPNSCINAVITGNFVKGVVLDTGAKVTIGVMVTTPGKYAVTTNNVNGYSFSGTGIFTVTGTQNVIVTASGIPVNGGVDYFTVNGNTSICNFPVTVLVGVTVSNTDHFPLTTNSNWTYDDLFNVGDSLKHSIIDSVNTNGSKYKVLKEQKQYGSPTYFQYRKTDSFYYEYTTIDKYTLSVKFSPQIIKDFPFLREDLSKGQTWITEEYIGPADFGQQIFLRYDFTCIDANAAVTVNGKTYTQVYKIIMKPMIRSATTYPYNSTGEKIDIWYAKGIGVIYSKKINNGFIIFENQIRSWDVR